MVRHTLCWTVSLAVLASAGAAQAQSQAPGQPKARFVLRPVRDGGPEVTAIEVKTRLEQPDPAAKLALVVPLTYPGAWRVAERVENLHVVDALGEVALVQQDQPERADGFPAFRRITPVRPIRYPVTVSYRARVQPPGQPQGPALGIRASAGGVSGAGGGFLVMPEGFDNGVTELTWDLSDLAKGSFGVTSYGQGDLKLAMGPTALMSSFVVAGPAGRYPLAGQSPFSAAWLGKFNIDPAVEMKWANDLYNAIGPAFGDTAPPPPYRVFMRYLDAPPAGISAIGPHSFLLSTGVGEEQSSPFHFRSLVAHEMLHQWTGQFEGPDGAVGWFVEGLNVFHTAVIPFRGGFRSVDEFGQEINEITDAYFQAPARLFSNDQIAKVGFADNVTRHVPYNRGALYFADLDATIRERSAGRRTLADLVRDLGRRRKAGERIDQALWLKLVEQEAGPGAVQTFQDVIVEGKAFEPRANAFGPCFERQPKTYAVAGQKIDGFQWVRRAQVSEQACRAWYGG
jgi:predicted metalloprotease with PDZ domain